MILSDVTGDVEYYGNLFDEIVVDFRIFIFLVIILLFVYIIRFFIMKDIEKDKIKRGKLKRGNIFYIINHCLLELIFSFLIAYIIIKLTHANPESYIINYIAAPTVGIIAAIFLDNKFLIPVEKKSGFGSLSNSKSEDKKDQTINININNDFDDDNDYKSKVNMINSVCANEFLEESDADSDDFNLKVIKSINTIKLEQSEQSTAINDNSIRLENTIATLNVLKESEMINKKVELKKMIYECLNQGYAKPEQNDKITLYYHSYRKLGGNHEIESLYEDHYLGLQVHEDRRIGKHKVEVERRDINKREYIYGEFDDEVNNKK